jgi:ABC-2 type transport system ATP-binding protein
MDGIRIENLTRTFRRGRVVALRNVSFDVPPGQICGIIGPNGAGKTTLMSCLLGYLRPDSGRVTIEGRAPDDLAIRCATGYLPERLVLDRWMTGRDFLRYHHALAGLPAAGRFREVEESLERVGLGDGAGGRRISQYSRGMLQRLGMAQALLGQPRWLFFDEPTSGMDPTGALLFRRLIGDLSGRGVTVILNSHQLEQVERVCHRVVFVRGGSVEAMETLDAGARIERPLRIRLARVVDPADANGAGAVAAPGAPPAESSGVPPARPPVEDLLPPGVRLTRADRTDYLFSVESDAAAAALIARLVGAGYPVVEAVPEEGRLERLFGDSRSGGAS